MKTRSLPLLAALLVLTLVGAPLATAQDGPPVITADNVEDVVEAAELTVDGVASFRDVAISPDGSRIAGAALAENGGGLVVLWDAADLDNPALLEGHSAGVESVAFSTDGAWLASGGDDSAVIIWDVAAQEAAHTLAGHGDFVVGVAFSPDGTLLASASYDRTVRLWDAATGEELFVLEHPFTVMGVAFSPDGSLLATAGGANDNAVHLWDPASGEEADNSPLEGLEAGALDVAFSPDGTRVAAAAANGTALVWTLGSDEEPLLIEVARRDRAASIAFSPDGSLVITGDLNESVMVWDAAEADELMELEGHDGGIFGVAVSADGTTIASAATDGSVRLWTLPAP